MIRLICDLVRTMFFLVSILVAFAAGAVVFNLDRLGILKVSEVKIPESVSGKVQEYLPENFPGISREIPPQNSAAKPLPSLRITGRVLNILDAGTFEMQTGAARIRIRLFAALPPEPGHPHAGKSAELLRRMIQNKFVSVQIAGTDASGCGFARVQCGAANVNLEMIRAGAVRLNAKTAEPEFARAQEEARNARRGLWQTNL